MTGSAIAGIFGWLMIAGIIATVRQNRRHATRTTVTVQHGSTALHIILTVITGGLWLPVWWAMRHTRHITTRRKS